MCLISFLTCLLRPTSVNCLVIISVILGVKWNNNFTSFQLQLMNISLPLTVTHTHTHTHTHTPAVSVADVTLHQVCVPDQQPCDDILLQCGQASSFSLTVQHAVVGSLVSTASDQQRLAADEAQSPGTAQHQPTANYCTYQTQQQQRHFKVLQCTSHYNQRIIVHQHVHTNVTIYCVSPWQQMKSASASL